MRPCSLTGHERHDNKWISIIRYWSIASTLRCMVFARLRGGKGDYGANEAFKDIDIKLIV